MSDDVSHGSIAGEGGGGDSPDLSAAGDGVPPESAERAACASPVRVDEESFAGEDDIPGDGEPLAQEEVDSDEAAQFAALRGGGDPTLRERLICNYLHLVPPLVRRFRDWNELREDLIQVGYVGLIKAVDGFDPCQKVRFITYATHCISGEIRHYMRDKAQSIRLPRWLTSLSSKVSAYLEHYLQQHKRLPPLPQIAEALNISEEGIVEILKAKGVISLSALEEIRGETIALRKIRSLRYQTLRLPVEDRIALMNALEQLKALEQKIVYLFFYMDLTQTQIAKQMGLSHKKVSRMLNKSLQKMKELLTRDIWPEKSGGRKK